MEKIKLLRERLQQKINELQSQIEEKAKGEGNWKNGPPPYIHGGSLSSGWNGYLSGKVPDVSNESAMQEMETRCAFWEIAAETLDCGGSGPLYNFRDQYMQGVLNLVTNAQLNYSRITAKKHIYRNFMKI